MLESLPIYQAKLDSVEDGIFSLSLVSDPATEFKMLCFKKEKLEFSIENQEEHIIKFPIMYADVPIYRRYLNYEFYITYSKDVLKNMAQRFLSENNQNNYDIEHDGVLLPKGSVQMIEIYQKDVANGIDPKGFESVTDGSLLATCRVNDETLWELCKSGELKGISLTGFFSLEEQFKSFKNKQIFKMKLEKLKSLLKDILLEYNSCESSIGQLYYNGDELMVGTPITDKEGNPVKDGEIKIDGYDLVIKNGAVEAMTPTASNEEQPQEEQPSEDPVIEEPKTEDEPKTDEEQPKEDEQEPKAEEQPIEETPTEETPVEEPQNDSSNVNSDEAEKDGLVNEVNGLVSDVNNPTEQNDISALKAEIDSLKTAVSELLVKISQPVEKPIIEESKEQFSAQYEDEGSYEGLPKGFERLMKRVSYLRKE